MQLGMSTLSLVLVNVYYLVKKMGATERDLCCILSGNCPRTSLRKREIRCANNLGGGKETCFRVTSNDFNFKLWMSRI